MEILKKREKNIGKILGFRRSYRYPVSYLLVFHTGCFIPVCTTALLGFKDFYLFLNIGKVF